MTRYIQILLLLLSLQASAQSDKTPQQTLPVLSAEYYSTQTFLKKNYDYELVNKRRALVKTSNDLIVLSAILAVGSYVTTASYIGEQNGWSLAVSIPVGALVGVGLATPFVLWSNHLRKKANRIQTETAYLLSLGKHTELGATLFTNTDNWKDHTIGIGIKTTF